MADPKVEAMRGVDLFAGLGSRELAAIASLMDEVDVPADQVFIREGETGQEMFVIVRGHVTIERGGSPVAEGGPGTVIGEMALLAEGPRTATVRTTEPSTFLVAAHREFHALLDDHPTIRDHVLAGLAQKLRELDATRVH